MPHFIILCQQCIRQFKNDNALQQHRRDSPMHRKPYHCPSCNRSFGDKYSLNNHIKALHYWCYTCSRGYVSIDAFNDHTKAVHYWCYTCSKGFFSTKALNDHNRMSSAHGYTYSASRGFLFKKALNDHNRMSSAHDLRLGDAKCQFCPSYFASPSAVAHHIESGCHGITRHQVTHVVKSLHIVPNICIAKRIEGASPTPPTTIRYYAASPSSFNGRAYACFLCQRVFRSLSSLSDHLNSAAHDANQFKCPKCKKRFKLVSALIQHIESAACNIAGLQQVQDHFQGLSAHFSRLISLQTF